MKRLFFRKEAPKATEGELESETVTIPLWASLPAKFAMCSLAILSIVLVLMNIYPMAASQTLVFRSKQATLHSQMAVISSVLLEQELLTPAGVERVLASIEPAGLSRIIVTDPSGFVLYDNGGKATISGQYAMMQEIYLALSGYDVTNTIFGQRSIFSNGAVPIVYGDNTIGAIYVQEEDAIQGQLLQSLRENLRTISWVAAGIATILYGIFSLLFTKRIRDLLAAIQIVGKGEYGHRLLPKGNDEMSYLANEFNQLTDRLQSTEEVRRRFVSDASHELRTPLASIQLLADSILHNQEIGLDMVREFVSDICMESGRLSRITERLLTLSKLDSLPAPVAEAVDVHAVIERVLQSLELVSDEGGVVLRFQPEEEEIRLLCTADKLHQICYNLLENAIKYTPVGGFAQISAKIQGDEVLIRVEDNGLGIPAEDLPKIFNRFYRVDDARSREAGGTGLGLSIVRDTLRAYGGWVEAGHNSPKGTIFTVGLPKAKEEKESKGEPGEEISESKGEGSLLPLSPEKKPKGEKKSKKSKEAKKSKKSKKSEEIEETGGEAE